MQTCPGPDQLPGLPEAADLARDAALAAGTARRTLAAANADLPRPGEPHLILWPAINVLREPHGDGHIAALQAAGLDPCEALVSVAAIGAATEEVFASRGWSTQEWSAVRDRLTARGWIDSTGQATELGRRGRDEIEWRTDRLASLAPACVDPGYRDRASARRPPLGQTSYREVMRIERVAGWPVGAVASGALRGLAASGQNGEMAADRQAGEAPAAVPGWARGVSRLTVLTGAGISTDSGIPDFRGPSGIWTKNPAAEKLSTYQAYMADPELRRRSWQSRLAHPAWAAEPNPAHLALAQLGRSAIDSRVITQNIDGLHQRAGTPPGRVIELHGTMSGVVCTGCGDRTAMTEALARVRAGETDPPCTRCGGILKSATIMFGEALEPEVFEAAVSAAAGCDLMLAIGSTLIVEPAASLCAIAAEAGAALVIVNRDPTPYDEVATAVIRDPIGTAVPRIAGQLLAASSM